MKHRNGEWIYILDRGKIASRDEQGNPIRFTGTHTDITELKKIQAHLEKEQQLVSEQAKLLTQTSNRYRSLLELASEATFIMNQHGKLLEYSHLAKEYLGYTDSEMQTLTISDWDKEITKEQFETLIDSFDGQVISLDRIHTRKDGTTYEASIQAKKLIIDNETLVHSLSLIHI